MQISIKNEAIHIENDSCVVTKYPLEDSLSDFAIVKMTGRYPSVKRAVNQKCNEIAYVFEGGGSVVVEGKEYSLNEGDAVLIEAGEKYYWEGNMKLFVSCRPAWAKDQHVMVD